MLPSLSSQMMPTLLIQNHIVIGADFLFWVRSELNGGARGRRIYSKIAYSTFMCELNISLVSSTQQTSTSTSTSTSGPSTSTSTST